MSLLRRFAVPALLAGLLVASASPARAAWSHDPSQNNTVNQLYGSQSVTAAIPDGSGGTFVLWQDSRTDLADLYLQHLTGKGNFAPGWTATGVPVCVAAAGQLGGPMCADNAGGVYVSWTDLRGATMKVYVQRITSAGTVSPGWPATGLQVATEAAYDEVQPRMCADGAGGVYVGWSRLFSGTDFDLRLTRVNPNATIAAGFPLFIDVAGLIQDALQLTPDGAGGVLAAYEDNVSGNYDIRVKRFNSSGFPLFSYLHGPFTGDQRDPQLVSDGFGGALVGFTDAGGISTSDVVRVNSTGNDLWTTTVLANVSDPRQLTSMVSDGARGAYVLARIPLFFNTGWAINHVAASGTIAPGWSGAAGREIANGLNSQALLAPDGKGGVLTLSWAPQLNVPSVNRWGANGVQAPGWPAAGAVVSADAGPNGVALVDDGNGGAIALLSDLRNGTDLDAFAQRVERFGQLGSPEPSIVSVKDVLLDQGGHVRVNWTPSWLDSDPSFGVVSYRVWRQVPAAAAQQALARGAGDRVITTREVGPFGAQTTYWELAGSQAASAQAGYSMVVATAGDSVAAGNPRLQCMVEAVGVYGGFWDSAPDSGYSVDNLPPAMPAPFTALWGGGSTRLTWGPNHEADFMTYRLYRGATAGFAIGTGSLFAEKPDTGYVAPAGNWYYKLTAVDVHGNESLVALVSPPGSVGVDDALPASLAFAMTSANPSRGTAQLRLALPRAARVNVAVYDAAGRLVRTLANGSREAGEYAFEWDGRDAVGGAAQAGLYFARLVTNGETRTLRLVRL